MPNIETPLEITSTLLIILLTTNFFISTEGKSEPLKCPIPPELKEKLHSDPSAIKIASNDYGNIVHILPFSVLFPLSPQDIQTLIKASYNCSHPFAIAIRGNGHSTKGQSMAHNGVVVDMQEYKKNINGTGVYVSNHGRSHAVHNMVDASPSYLEQTYLSNTKKCYVPVSVKPLYVDVGAEMLWRDVMLYTLKEGVLPVSWVDFLGLTVGGTLSHAGVSGQTFRFGPQISNVYELDVITGKGEMVTCSENRNSKLFYAVLGGLGQFGVITRARIAVEPAKERVRWIRILYSDFFSFTKDQESIIAVNGRNNPMAVSYLEGHILLDNGTPNEWHTSFFPKKDLPKILSLVKKYGVIYSIEIADTYDDSNSHDVGKKLKQLIKGLNPIPGMVFQLDVPYVDFLNRVQLQVLENESHPWLNLFLPKSGIFDFNSGVIRDILLKRNMTFGPIIFYPVNRNKWDVRMSATTPEEEIFYIVSLLFTSEVKDWRRYYDQNDAIIKFCAEAGIKIKAYLANYSRKEQWVTHFGSKWANIERSKHEFDPKYILSPGQNIFT